MQVILRESVEHLGKRGDVVKVAAGYARNFLIPKQLAYPFTEGVRRQVESEGRARESREARERGNAESVAARIDQLQVVRLARKAGESGSLFGSVTNKDIAAVLGERGVDVDRRSIHLSEPIRRIGTHRVKIHLHREIETELVVEVEPESAGSGA
jgi:large subunit ribosomal protein L9